jgi:hypothetical protein
VATVLENEGPKIGRDKVTFNGSMIASYNIVRFHTYCHIYILKFVANIKNVQFQQITLE